MLRARKVKFFLIAINIQQIFFVSVDVSSFIRMRFSTSKPLKLI